MIDRIFPFKLQLHIFQLEEYKPVRFMRWILKNSFTRKVEGKKPIVWTTKAKIILAFALVYLTWMFSYLTLRLGIFGFVIGLNIATQAYVFLLLGFFTLKPYEINNRRKTKKRILNKVLSIKRDGLKVIGIAGSYGKTSVKEFLYQLLKTKYRVLKTPESYNTLFGISKVIDYELINDYDFFICEMGAYTLGEIAEICSIVKPDHAVLTGINEQHIERFGKIENTIKAKFELVDNTPAEGIILLNGDNFFIRNNYLKYTQTPIFYGTENGRFAARNINTNTDRTEFSLILEGREYRVWTNLIGKSNITNITAAAAMAFLLGVSPDTLIDSINKLKPVPHRLELKQLATGITLIDDAYSSNITGFKEALNILKDNFAGYEKILVTPGIVELGSITHDVHVDLGKTADSICDKIVLVGNNIRTQSLSDGVMDKSKITFVDSVKTVTDMINYNIYSKTVLLLENDLPDNY
jgi:UDP-N-acetylmuramoyl-tripeptide--D-alanyl-D-alanine ligase